METTVKPLPGSQIQLTITLEPVEVNSFFEKVYQRLSRSGRIRGFRPGKAPKSIIRRVFGEDQIRASAYVQIIEELLPKALEALGDRPILGEPALPAFEEVALAENCGVTLPITVSVYPEAQVGELGEVKIFRPPLEVTQEEVEEVLNELREQKAGWQEVTRAVAPGDRVTADVAFYEGDELKSSREGMTFDAVAPEEGEEATVASKVVGHFVGQTVVVETRGDEVEESEGSPRRVEAVIRKVEEKVLPELDDDFARSVGDYENLEALRQDVRAQLAAQKKRRAWERMESQAMAYLLAATDVELPEILLRQATAARLDNLDEDLKSIGSSLEELAAAGSLDLSKVEDVERQRATIGLEIKLAVDALAKAESLEPEEQDVEAEIEELARKTRNDVEFVRHAYELQDAVREQIDNRARLRRVARWVIEKAQVEELSKEEFDERYRQLLEELETRRRQRREAKPQEALAATGEGEDAQASVPAASDQQLEDAAAAAPAAEGAPVEKAAPETPFAAEAAE